MHFEIRSPSLVGALVAHRDVRQVERVESMREHAPIWHRRANVVHETRRSTGTWPLELPDVPLTWRLDTGVGRYLMFR